jgi:hypothetical protein
MPTTDLYNVIFKVSLWTKKKQLLTKESPNNFLLDRDPDIALFRNFLFKCSVWLIYKTSKIFMYFFVFTKIFYTKKIITLQIMKIIVSVYGTEYKTGPLHPDQGSVTQPVLKKGISDVEFRTFVWKLKNKNIKFSWTNLFIFSLSQ